MFQEEQDAKNAKKEARKAEEQAKLDALEAKRKAKILEQERKRKMYEEVMQRSGIKKA